MAVFLNKAPTELRKILQDFIRNCLLENPDDFVDHGLAYFLKMRECRNNDKKSSIEVEKDEVESEENQDDDLSMDHDSFKKMATRRASVVGEGYNPADDNLSIISTIFFKTQEEWNKLAEDIKSVLLFRSLDREEITSLMHTMKSRLVTKDEIIIEQGDVDASEFYVIESGSYEAWVTDQNGVPNLVKVYQDRGSFGELALLYNVPRAATIKTISDGKLWVLDRETFKKIVLKSAHHKRERYQKFFEQVEFLNALSSYAKLDLADSIIPKFYEDGEVIFRQGDDADGMYFIESGVITCLVDHPLQGEVIVTELREGDYLGELALITHNQRALTAQAVGNTKLAFLDKETFERLLGPCQEYFKKNISVYEEKMTAVVGSASSVFYQESKISFI